MRDITAKMVDEHRLIKRMLNILEHNATALLTGTFDDYGFFLQAVDFIRSYADRYHHAKEEDVLFEALVENGMPRENSPIAAMLMEHDQGRAHVREMERGAEAALTGTTGMETAIAAQALAYIELLRGHIDKEDTILYPLAERLLPEEMRSGIIERYEIAEAQVPAGFEARYEEIIAAYEGKIRHAA